MATLTVKLAPQTLRRLIEAARREGLTPEQLAERMLESFALSEDLPATDRPSGVSEPTATWTVDVPRTTPADYEGPFVELDKALDDFSAELERRLAGRSG